jgi:hypothetical protein
MSGSPAASIDDGGCNNQLTADLPPITREIVTYAVELLRVCVSYCSHADGH